MPMYAYLPVRGVRAIKQAFHPVAVGLPCTPLAPPQSPLFGVGYGIIFYVG